MARTERQSGIELIHTNDDALPERRTYICMGVPRGGTSAVAGTMQRLGLFIGEDLPNNYEDPCFVGQTPSNMKEVIAARQKNHAVWGWKHPSAANYMENLLPDLENPHLIVVWRDLVATMKAHRRWHNRGQLLSVHEILMQHQRNWFLIERWKIPTALVSYEKTILNPALFAKQMADFLGMPEPKGEARDEIITFLKPGSYK